MIEAVFECVGFVAFIALCYFLGAATRRLIYPNTNKGESK